MRHNTRGLAGLLITSAMLCVTSPVSLASEASARGFASTSDAPASQIAATTDAAVVEREAGRALLRRGKAGEALVHLEKALPLFRASGNKLGEAATQDLLGDLYDRQGRYDVALEHFQAAHEIYTALAVAENAQPDVVAVLSPKDGAFNANLMLAKIGGMYERGGDAERARAAYARMNVTMPERNALKTAQGGQAKVQSKIGKLRGFGSRMKGAVSGTPNASTPGQAADVVTDTVSSIRGPFEAYRESLIYSVYELGTGRVDYLNEQYDSARKHFENVLAASLANLPGIGARSRTRVFRAAARTSLGDIAFRQSRFSDAIKFYADAAKGAQADERLDLMWPAQRGTGRSLWAQAARETDATRSAKLREDALAAYREALKTIETIRQGSLRADESRATFLATTADVFNEASAALAEMSLSAQTATTATAAAATTSAPVNRNSSNPAPLEGKSLAYAAESLQIVEQGRARSLLDLLNETGASITEGVPAELLQRKTENQQRQEEIAAQLTGVTLSNEPPGKSLDELEAELNKLQTEFDSIENSIRTASPRYAALTNSQPLALTDIQGKVLDEQTTLLEYSLGAEHSYLYAVTPRAMSVYRLPPRAEVERQAKAVREQIIPSMLRRSSTDTTTAAATNNTQRGLSSGAAAAASSGAASTAAALEYAKAAHEFYQTAVEPAAPLFKNTRLLIVADGALNYIPFHALVTSVPATNADYATLPYLTKTNDTLFAPSASVVAAIRQQSAANNGGGAGNNARAGAMLLVADPVFDAGDARASRLSSVKGDATTTAGDETASRGLSVESALADVAQGGGGGESSGAAGETSGKGAGGARLPRLAGTRAEAQGIARLAASSGRKVDTWLDLDANEASVETRDLKSYRVLHFATHGLLNAERPQFTGVVLSLVGNKESADGFLRTDEIFNLRLGSPLVMLSACETGLGRETRGEGVLGLTRAFMYAGAPTVGVSLWSVSDKSTADLMTDFYKNLLAKDGMTATTPAAAIRLARQNMIAGRKYSAPFYWAPFVLVGDWR